LKIAVSATGADLDATVDPRFGRCPFFMIVDADTMRFEAVPNVSQQSPSGAGIEAAQIIVSKGVEVVLTGNVGPNAYQALSAAGIQVITGVTGTVKEAVEKYKGGRVPHPSLLLPVMVWGLRTVCVGDVEDEVWVQAVG